MTCCGRRVSLTAAPRRIEAAVVNDSAATPAIRHGVLLRYREVARVVVHGPITGRRYHFAASAPVAAVDPRDVEQLLRSRYFSRA